MGVWVHNEYRLTNIIALRSELGFDAGISSSSYANDNAKQLIAPAITLEPRWYYNLNKRNKKSKRIDGNSGNFVSLKTTYHPDFLIISSEDNINFITDISIVPTWGIRRNIGNHFNYETGIGVGYVHYFKEENVIADGLNSDVAVNLHLRIGYQF